MTIGGLHHGPDGDSRQFENLTVDDLCERLNRKIEVKKIQLEQFYAKLGREYLHRSDGKNVAAHEIIATCNSLETEIDHIRWAVAVISQVFED